MKLSSLQSKVLLLVAGAMAFVLAVSVLALNHVYRSVEDLDRVSREDFFSQQLILQAQVAFRKQVEDWDGLLLRVEPIPEIEAAGGHAALERDLAVVDRTDQTDGGAVVAGVAQCARESEVDPVFGSYQTAGIGVLPLHHRLQ